MAELRRERLSERVEIDPVQQASWKVFDAERRVRKHNTAANRAALSGAKAALSALLRGEKA